MNCREVADFLSAYLDGELSQATKREFDAHLAECPACVAYLEGYQRTLVALKLVAGIPEKTVEPVPEEIIQAILYAQSQTAA
ncbi:conserved hypothetical protein [Planctopirus limnophila DSM 3776]|uniref:Putative zinc-finger domain-containing protein n=1 Tax=Planctopirus limnophila (strain ATCC 43296 / DSM 3776 / IFAM 1008 / Mu 290) TaxID=521674 RepID=D5SWM9_PLAL2|nr:zf-HC2 domain-containing protein [Planctopirus limnophila]ADG69622.1 conserved hypothetical protein [Planctopirus limnophila DSM 3776]